MKKIKLLSLFVIVLFTALILTSCMADTSGYKYDLVSSKWNAEQKGGSCISLSFDENNAYLTASSGDTEIKINGRYAADDYSFVIFNTAYPENYRFYYQLNGENLSLTYSGNTIVLKQQKL